MSVLFGAARVTHQPMPDTGDLDGMRVAELRAIAESMGIDVPAKARKSDIIAAIRGKG